MTIKEIQTIMKDFEKSSMRTLEIEIEGVKIKLSKNEHETKHAIPVTNHVENVDVPVEKVVNANETKVRSPLVGTFYRASSPGDKPFVEVGQKVKKGDVLCIIEAMKIMNEIAADVSGIIQEIHFNDKDVVSFDDPLMTIVKDHEA